MKLQRRTTAENNPEHPLPVFTPSKSQLRFLLTLEDALHGRQSVSDTALCHKLKMSRTTLWQWKQDAEFGSWLRESLQRTSDDNWPLIIRRHEHLAIQGSVRSAEFVLKVRQMAFAVSTETLTDGRADATNYTIISLVPRPPNETP